MHPPSPSSPYQHQSISRRTPNDFAESLKALNEDFAHQIDSLETLTKKIEYLKLVSVEPPSSDDSLESTIHFYQHVAETIQTAENWKVLIDDMNSLSTQSSKLAGALDAQIKFMEEQLKELDKSEQVFHTISKKQKTNSRLSLELSHSLKNLTPEKK
jgi:hypothetical protein